MYFQFRVYFKKYTDLLPHPLIQIPGRKEQHTMAAINETLITMTLAFMAANVVLLEN